MARLPEAVRLRIESLVKYQRANYCRRPPHHRGKIPQNERRATSPWLHDGEQGLGFREAWVSYTQSFMARYGAGGERPGRSIRPGESGEFYVS